MKLWRIIQKNKIKGVILISLLIWYCFSLPKQLFQTPTSTIIESSEGDLLGAKIAGDGQWRFPKKDSISTKFEDCIVEFEDAYFYKHPGFNPISMFKALKQNLKAKKAKRGGSTLTQQVIRLSRNGKKRTYFEKIVELILATRLELKYSKKEILSFYAANAPFGGNVVGVEAASWRYFGRNTHALSWAETATLAVLPNAPSLIYPGKNQQKLLEKRNRLLKKLLDEQYIDELTYKLSIIEILPQKPYPLPQIAPHLLEKTVKFYKGKRIKTSVKKELQEQANNIIKNHYNELKQNQIHNISVLILDVKTRKVLTYIGNSPTNKENHKDVDIIDKPRSTGSILKPFLYTAMLDAGDILPKTLIADVPTTIASYNPQNFNQKFDGAVFADEALSRSLNVPAVRMLQSFGLDRFHHYLKKLNLKDIKYNANHYGLSLILGGAESNLWDLCKSYASLSSTINHYDDTSGEYYKNEFIEPSFLHDFAADFGKTSTEKTLFDAGSIYMTFESMKKVSRPDSEGNWELFDSSKKIAWKTGTSFGFRDAWAIGVTKDYVVGVWVGNADGEGRPGLVGVTTAAPILFDVFETLPQSSWFQKPFDELVEIEICSKSGYRVSEICEKKEKQFVQVSGLKTKPCPYHQWVHLDENEEYQVNSSCEQLNKMTHKSWFVLPPLMEYYYQQKNSIYKALPRYKKECEGENIQLMDFVYPKENLSVYLPKNLNGKTNELVLKITHSIPKTKVFWYLDEKFIRQTKELHQLAIKPQKGNYKITALDEYGNEISRRIEIKD